jgi:hypothetical protein
MANEAWTPRLAARPVPAELPPGVRKASDGREGVRAEHMHALCGGRGLHVREVVHGRPTLTFNPCSAAAAGTGSRPASCSSATASCSRTWTSSGCASRWARTWPYALRLVLRRQPLRLEHPICSMEIVILMAWSIWKYRNGWVFF